ncbi:hypothetical protein ACFOLF_32935 [Paenibacillus sepulcri]|uniref:Uncharacterized protein n=1 Tax=Paenibacillus sepulcri TaxID=359917 RepID=A0ABS7CGL5_9BACL|nr:hypothetical protein [Paenibacillus sepulcri]
MMKNEMMEHAALNVTVSYLVKAKSKVHALDMARFQLNEETISLDRIQLVNDQGMKRLLKVEHVEFIHWMAAESSEFCDQFKVIGHFRLALRLSHAEEPYEENIHKHHYRLPRSAIQDKTVWVIPTLHQPAFTQVISQTLEWKTKARETTALITAV